MPTADLRAITDFESLRDFLEDELDWNLAGYSFEDLTFTYKAEELGLKPEEVAGLRAIHQLRPLSGQQPWGIFFVEFESKRLPVVVMRRILSALVLRKRASANQSERAAFAPDDLLFITRFGTAAEPEIAFAHFHQENARTLPVLRVLGWDGQDTPLKLERVAHILRERLAWPEDDSNHAAWREQWAGAFRHRIGHVIKTSDLLATELAALARRVRAAATAIMQRETEKGPLTRLFLAFKEALLHDLTPETFADTYAQTISYGLFTAAISRTVPGEGKQGTYLSSIHVADLVPVTSPFLKEMLATFLEVGGKKGGLDFDELGVQSIVDLFTGEETDMDAILRDFGNKTRGEDPVIHFYEHFLTAYNKALKIQRGVFYTPQPVVSYIVRSVHELLKTEFGLEHGLADTTTWGEMLKKFPGLKLPPLTDEPGCKDTISPDEFFVQILDPATGTATFPVEVIDLIFKHLKALFEKRGPAAMPSIPNSKPNIQNWDDYWNEYVPKALLPRLHAFELMMAPYAIAHMKIGLKLAETGYQFQSNERARIYLTNALEPWFKQLPLIGFDALAHEAAAVNEIKRHKRFTVVIGNPPYSGESANKIASVERDVKETYQAIDGIPLKEKGKKNWLLDDYVKFLRLSHRTIAMTGCGFVGHIINNAFQDNPTFRGLRRSLLRDFSTAQILDLHGSGTRSDSNEEAEGDENVFDILQGVCVVVLSRPAKTLDVVTVTRGDLWGRREKKYKLLAEAASASLIRERVQPKPDQYYFIPLDLTHEAEWSNCASLLDAIPINGNGLISAKDHFAYAFTAAEFERDLAVFLDAGISDAQVAERLGIRDNSMWSLHEGRLRLRRERSAAKFCRVAYRPFDIRHSLFHRDIIFNLRLPVTQHIIGGKNLVLLLTRMTKGDEWRHCFVSRSVSDCALLSNQTSTNAFAFPLRQKASAEGLFAAPDGYEANLSPDFLTRFAKVLGISLGGKLKEQTLTPENIFHYAYAVFHSPGYRTRYAEFLKIDFPRLPLTSSLDLFRALARLGAELSALHLLESPKLDTPITEFSGGAREVAKVGWTPDHGGTVLIDAGGKKAATTPGTSGFRGVPEAVWNFHIGGYQVCEKWLKDRKGRTLTDEDLAHYHKIVVALSETIRLMAEIDEVINQHGGWPGAFSQKS
jgi:hypothetical protein